MDQSKFNEFQTEQLQLLEKLLKEPIFHIDELHNHSHLRSIKIEKEAEIEFSRNASWTQVNHSNIRKLQISKFIEDGEICNNLINSSLRVILENEEKFKRVEESDVMTLNSQELSNVTEIKTEQIFSNEGFQKKQSKMFRDILDSSLTNYKSNSENQLLTEASKLTALCVNNSHYYQLAKAPKLYVKPKEVSKLISKIRENKFN